MCFDDLNPKILLIMAFFLYHKISCSVRMSMKKVFLTSAPETTTLNQEQF